MTSGLPDYQIEIWRANNTLGTELKEDETLGGISLLLSADASFMPYYKPPLAPGETVKAVDVSTGVDDVIIPKGYTLSVLINNWSFSRPVIGHESWDGMIISNTHESSFLKTFFSVLTPNYSFFDPTGAAAHTWSVDWTNLGDADMEGMYAASFILKEVGTERAETKTVRCNRCGAERVVDRRATWVRCHGCGQVGFYMPRLFGMREKAITEVIE